MSESIGVTEWDIQVSCAYTELLGNMRPTEQFHLPLCSWCDWNDIYFLLWCHAFDIRFFMTFLSVGFAVVVVVLFCFVLFFVFCFCWFFALLKKPTECNEAKTKARPKLVHLLIRIQ